MLTQHSERLSSGNLSWDDDATEAAVQPHPTGSQGPPASGTSSQQGPSTLLPDFANGTLQEAKVFGGAAEQSIPAQQHGNAPVAGPLAAGSNAAASDPGGAEPGSNVKGPLLNTFGNWGSSASQSRVATGLQGMLGNTSNLEIPSFARNLIRKSGSNPPEPKRAPRR